MMTEQDYIDAHIDAEPPLLRALYKDTHLHRLYPRMCTDHAQGRLLAMITRLVRPRHVLELGTFSGYSALCFAEALPEGGTVDTVEIDTDYTEDLLELFEGRPITLHTGDALQLLPQLLAAKPYDLVFIDADKRVYTQYYQMIVEAIPSGAFIIADNTLWADKVLNPDARDPQTEGIRRFNDTVAADERVYKVMLPIGDGLTVIAKK